MPARPDIVLLILDTQRSDRLSCYGHQLETTPALDRLSTDATQYLRAVSAAQWTIPSHASMFTGLYPSVHTMVQTDYKLPTSLRALAERLSDAGYFTAGFCNNPLVGVVQNGLRRGFQSWLNYSGWLTNRPNEIGPRRATLLGRYRQWFKRRLADILGAAQDAFARSDLLLDLSFSPLMVPLWQTAMSFKGNTGKSLQDAARLHIERPGLDRDTPIFSFINLMGTHAPYRPPYSFMQHFAPEVLSDPEARVYLRRFNNDIYGWLAPLNSDLTPHQKQIIDGVYNAETAHQDAQIGEFLNRMQQSGRLDRTLLIVSADHGDHLGEKRMMGHSFTLYDDLVRVPLLIRDPAGDFPRGQQIEQPVSTRRIFHTVLSAAGIANSDERRLTLAAATGVDDPEHGIAFSEAVPPSNVLNILRRRRPDLVSSRGCDHIRRSVSQGDLKLIITEDHSVELFNIHDDPAEEVNLIEILPEQVEQLNERLQAFVAHASTIAQPISAGVRVEDDPVLRRRLHELGYLE